MVFVSSIGKYVFPVVMRVEQLLEHGLYSWAGPRSAIGRTPDSYVRGPGFDTRSGNILSFLLPLFQEGQLSVTGESMCTMYCLTA